MEEYNWPSNCAHLRTGLHRVENNVKCPHCQMVTYCGESCRRSEWRQHHVLFCHSMPYKKRLENRCNFYEKLGDDWLVNANLYRGVIFPAQEISLSPFRRGCILCERKLGKKDFQKMKHILNGQTLSQKTKNGTFINYELCPKCLHSGNDICLRSYQNVFDCNRENSQKSLLLYSWMNHFQLSPDLVRYIWSFFLVESECTGGHEIVKRKGGESKSTISRIFGIIGDFF